MFDYQTLNFCTSLCLTGKLQRRFLQIPNKGKDGKVGKNQFVDN